MQDGWGDGSRSCWSRSSWAAARRPAAAVRPDVPTYSPRREALSYFPADAPLVAVVRTDPQDPGLRRLAGSGALAPLRRAAERARRCSSSSCAGCSATTRWSGMPHAGGPPLGVLVTDDGDTLAAFARSRVLARTATRAGTYRGAELYAEPGWAFGVRDEVLLVGGSAGGAAGGARHAGRRRRLRGGAAQRGAAGRLAAGDLRARVRGPEGAGGPGGRRRRARSRCSGRSAARASSSGPATWS